MKKIAILALSLISVFGVSSCVREALDIQELEKDEVRRVDFNAHVEQTVDFDTRTGLKLLMVHTWVSTKPENIHLFEKNNLNGDMMEGEDVTITTEDPYDYATFSAGFYNSIIVEPETKASVGAKSYTYTGVVAQRNSDNKYFIPAVQYTQPGPMIDPDADFLIGQAFVSSTTLNEKSIDFTFQRPVAASRLAITNIEGTYIKSVTITSDDELTGEAGFFDIDFENCSVNLTGGSKTVQIVFPENSKKSGTTYAYFITSTGTKHVTSVEVETDEYIYTKLLDVNTNFKSGTFLNIAMDMTLKEGICTRTHSAKQPLRFIKDEENIVADSYDMNSGVAYVTPVFSGAAEGAEVSYSSDNEQVATVNEVEGVLVVTPIAVGQAKITATAGEVEGYDETSISYTLTVTDSSLPVDQILEFSQTEIAYTYGETFTKPDLTGNHTEVTFSTDTEEVATVNATTGDLTFKGVAGTVTVTATAPAGEVGGVNYAKGSASYTVTVTVPSTDLTFYKAGDVDAGYAYLIVCDNKALTNDEGVVAAADVVVNAGTITLPSADNMLWTVVSETDNDLLEYGKYHLTNDSKYLSRISGSSSTSNLEIHAATDTEIATKMKYTMWDNDANNFWNTSIYNSNPSTYYAYVSSGAWVINTTTPSVNVAFYTTRQPQTVSFTSAPGASVDMAQTTSFQLAVSAQTDVTFESKTDAASVSATGLVTFNKAGAAKIVATASGSDTYQGASAACEFTIINSSVTETVLNQVTSVKDGGMYVMVNEGKALKNNNKAMDALNVTVSEDKSTVTIASDVTLDDIVWTWTSSSLDTDYGNYTITNNGTYLRVSGSYNDGYSAAFADLDTANGKYFVWVYSSNKVVNGSSNSKRYLTYNNGWTVPTSSSSSTDTYLYEYVDPRASQTVNFTQYPDGKTHDMAGSNTTFTVAASAQTAVTYSVDDSSIATVNSTSGLVTCLKKGTVKITATAAGNATYKPASADIEIKITNSDVKTTTYYKVTSVSEGNSYIIVSNGYALKNNNGSVAAESVSVNSGTIEVEDASALLWTAGASISAADGYRGPTFKNGSYYLVRASQASAPTLNTSVSNKYANLTYTESSTSGVYSFQSGSSSYIYYIYCDAGSWKSSTSWSSSKEVTLYSTDKPVTYSYTKVTTATTSLVDGTYLIVNPALSQAFDGTSTGTSNTVAVSPSSNTISGNYSANEFEIKAVEGGYTLKHISDSKYLQHNSSSNPYIAYGSSAKVFSIQTTSKGTDRFCFQYNDDDSEYLYYNSSNYFKIGGSGAPSKDDAGVLLFKKTVE